MSCFTIQFLTEFIDDKEPTLMKPNSLTHLGLKILFLIDLIQFRGG